MVIELAAQMLVGGRTFRFLTVGRLTAAGNGVSYGRLLLAGGPRS